MCGHGYTEYIHPEDWTYTFMLGSNVAHHWTSTGGNLFYHKYPLLGTRMNMNHDYHQGEQWVDKIDGVVVGNWEDNTGSTHIQNSPPATGIYACGTSSDDTPWTWVGTRISKVDHVLS